MLLHRVVQVSLAVAGTRSRTAKRDLIAAVLREVPAAEVEVATAYLAGILPQRRTGVGWRSLRDLPPPAEQASATLAEVDRVLDGLAGLAGPGSAGERRDRLAALFVRLAADEQEYVAGLLTGNLRQGAQDAVVVEAIAQAAELPVTLVRRAATFSALTGPVAVAALSGGQEALARFGLVAGRPVRPMLAASAPDPTAAVERIDGAVAVDAKLDGVRIQVHKVGEEVAVFTRSLDEVSERMPTVVEAVRRLEAETVVLDGEALLVDADRRPRPFQETSSAAASGLDSTLAPFFFDLLLLGERDLMTAPLEERLRTLDGLVPEHSRVPRILGADAAEAEEFFHATVAAGQEGVVVKRLDAPYDAGRRGSAWVKVKPRHTLDLVVLAVEWGSGRRRGLLSNIHLGARDPDSPDTDTEPRFVMLGKTFKGMTDAMLAWQTERFLELETHRESHVVHVRPEQVVEIAFDGVQRSTRYPGGVALRFARVLRYRDDKRPEEADTIDSVRAMLPLVGE